jgi:hypothetical protein
MNNAVVIVKVYKAINDLFAIKFCYWNDSTASNRYDSQLTA